MQIQTVPRPYILTFSQSGNAYPLTSDEAQALIDTYPVIRASRNVVRLKSEGTGYAQLNPATLGGGSAFVVTR